MRANDIKHEVDQLSMSEKLLLVEEIWNSIALSNDQIPLHERQKTELDKRYAEGVLNLQIGQRVYGLPTSACQPSRVLRNRCRVF